jgi:hypothetical protein
LAQIRSPNTSADEPFRTIPEGQIERRKRTI